MKTKNWTIILSIVLAIVASYAVYVSFFKSVELVVPEGKKLVDTEKLAKLQKDADLAKKQEERFIRDSTERAEKKAALEKARQDSIQRANKIARYDSIEARIGWDKVDFSLFAEVDTNQNFRYIDLEQKIGEISVVEGMYDMKWHVLRFLDKGHHDLPTLLNIINKKHQEILDWCVNNQNVTYNVMQQLGEKNPGLWDPYLIEMLEGRFPYEKQFRAFYMDVKKGEKRINGYGSDLGGYNEDAPDWKEFKENFFKENPTAFFGLRDGKVLAEVFEKWRRCQNFTTEVQPSVAKIIRLYNAINEDNKELVAQLTKEYGSINLADATEKEDEKSVTEQEEIDIFN